MRGILWKTNYKNNGILENKEIEKNTHNIYAERGQSTYGGIMGEVLDTVKLLNIISLKPDRRLIQLSPSRSFR